MYPPPPGYNGYNNYASAPPAGYAMPPPQAGYAMPPPQPGYAMPPPGRGYPPAPFPGAPLPAPGMFGLPPHLAAFNRHYDADQTWDCSASDAAKELGLIQSRANDMYPQGRENCLNFLRECGAKGYAFKVKAVKTKPYWTWYFEINNAYGTPAPAPAPAYGGISLPSHLASFTMHFDSDQQWNCSPSDADKELGLIDSRRNDIYPQGRDNCMSFLRECRARGYPFVVKAVKTKPYWTWYFEVNNNGYSTPAPAPAPVPVYGGISLPSHLASFTMHFNADQQWNCSASDAAKELGLIQSRVNDIYPQGRDNCMSFLRECGARGYPFVVKAVKTKPYWTWYFEVNNGAQPQPSHPSRPSQPSRSYGVSLPSHLASFTMQFKADETWNCSASDAAKELGLIQSRVNDIYPQGRDNCMSFLRECSARGYRFKVKAVKTKPYWTWYFEVVA